MKKHIVFALALLLPIFLDAQNNIDAIKYIYHIDLNDDNDSINCWADIRFLVVQNSQIAEFDLASISKGKGMQISGVYIDTLGNAIQTFTHKNDKLQIQWPYELRKGDSTRVIIYYKGIPADGLIISKNKYGHRTFFADNWPDRAHQWLACNDKPEDKAMVQFIVTAPSHYQIISNGLLVEETEFDKNKKLTHWKEDTPLPTKVMVIGVADFAIDKVGEVNSLPVTSWVFPENKAEGFYDYAPAKDIFAWYINYIGPYAFKKLANIQSKTVYGGMENASAIFYHENSVTGNRDEVALLAHEIAHQWFGNSVTEKSFAHLWLSEGFATYLTHLYLESVFETDSLNKRMQNDRDEISAFVKATKRPVVDSTSNYLSLLNANSYQKGSWVLHMLRRELGDSVFHKIIREYYTQYAGGNADTDDFRKVAEAVSGKDLKPFFKQWLFTGENLSLGIKWTYNIKKKAVKIIISQKQSIEFNFPVTIMLNNTVGKSITYRFTISKKDQKLILPAAKKPVSITADPNTSLLAEITVIPLK